MDNEDIKKVNNEETAPETQQAEKKETDAFDDILNGMYDLARMYSTSETEREKAIREQDEKRREDEMAAIREDIERRYSLQVEEARNNMDSILGVTSQPSPETPAYTPSAPSDTGTASPAGDVSRLDEMIDLEAIRDNPNEGLDAKKKARAEKHQQAAENRKSGKEKKRKPTEYIDLDEKNGLYAAIYSLGDSVIRALMRMLGIILHVISLPIVKIRNVIKDSSIGTKRAFRDSAKAFAQEAVYFRHEIKSANRNLLKSLKHPLSIPGILWHYIAKAFRRHKKLMKTVCNVALPIIAVVVLVYVFNYWNNVTFALDVTYNGVHIGYISDESVFIEARDLVIDRLSANTVNDDSAQVTAKDLDAKYKLVLISYDKLNDAYTISDNMIEKSADNLTSACGIYIDGDFICAVKNEADAKTVFDNILSPYEKDAENGNYTIGFAEDIDYVQGLYRDDSTVMWDAAQLEKTILGEQGASVYYTVMAGDTLDSIAAEYNTDVSTLLSLNSGLTAESEITEGDTISVPSYDEMVRVKKTYTSSRVTTIAYDTITQRDVTRYSGYRVVNQEGKPGTQRIITTKVYVDDELDESLSSVRSEVIIPATDEIIVVGTKTTYNGLYIGEASDKGFLWPAPSCHYISSPYGWRSSGWHKGVDLCTTNGTAYGTPVIASRSGTVEVVQRSDQSYGHMVLIDHGDGYKTRYAHMIAGSITVNVGDYVEAGQTIGRVGSTGNSSGPHLHFEVIYNGENQNPQKYISG